MRPLLRYAIHSFGRAMIVPSPPARSLIKSTGRRVVIADTALPWGHSLKAAAEYRQHADECRARARQMPRRGAARTAPRHGTDFGRFRPAENSRILALRERCLHASYSRVAADRK
jgi:hypothetical protein